MKGHGGYVRVDEQGEAIPTQEDSKELPMTAPTPVKRMGRPRRAAAEVTI